MRFISELAWHFGQSQRLVVDERTRGGRNLGGEKSAIVETFTQFAQTFVVIHH